MTTVTNTSSRELLALDVEGVDYHSAPGEALEVQPRTALLLREAGWTMTPEQQRAAIASDDAPDAQPLTDDETRYTGGRHHRIDDPRANIPGTPVEVTGDTGSPMNLLAAAGVVEGPDVPGVPAVKARRRRGQSETAEAPSVEAGVDLTVKSTPQEADAEATVLPDPTPTDVSTRPVVTAQTSPGQAPTEAPVAVQVDHTVATGEHLTDAAGGNVPESVAAAVPGPGTPEFDARTSELLDGVSSLRGAALDDALVQAHLDPANKTRDAKVEELRAAILASRS